MSIFKKPLLTEDGEPLYPVQDDTVLLLRRIVKLLEASGTVDANNRQRIAVDSVTTSALYTGGGSTALGGETITAGAPTVAGTIYPFYVWETPVDQRWRIIDAARASYDLGIRSKLSFT